MPGIQCSVRPHGTETAVPNTVSGDAADGFDATETAAIIALMRNADDTVEIGGKTYRNTAGALVEVTAPPPPVPPPPDLGTDIPTERPTGGTSAIEISGRGMIGGHTGGSLEAGYVHELPTHPNARLEIGAHVRGGSVSRDYTLPGGGDANSRFNFVGAGGSIGGRFPYAWQNRIFAGVRAALTLSGVWTPSSTMGTVAGGGGQVCYDSGAGRQQCEERAGGSQANLGTTGGYNPAAGNSREQSGLGLDAALRLIPFGIRFPVGDGAIDASLNLDLGLFNTFTGAGVQTMPYIAPGVGARWVF